jgi:prevent-host-death family protein
VIVVRLMSSWYTSGGDQIRTTYSADEVDAVAVYCQDLDRCYLLPVSLFDGMRGLSLRVAATRNGQRASLHWARDHELSGAVAQLGERRYGIPEATGSSPVSSTPSEPASHTVGAHQFRNHFGWYMERTVAGEEFLVTRRGKPCVRLVPAHAQLPIAD